MKEIVLYLIRHGKTFCNEQRLYCGKSDIELSEYGVRELEELRRSIDYPRCNLNFTSGAKRAIKTFEILYPNTSHSNKIGFWEYDFGDFELKSYEMLKEDTRYIEWICDKSKKVKCPNGESKKEFYRRLEKSFVEFLNEIYESNEKEALIVCHGGTIGTLLELFSNGDKDFYSYQPGCGRGYAVKVNFESEVNIEILEEF